MESTKSPKSPVFAQSHAWKIEKRKGIYESDVTAMVRGMLEDKQILEDQRAAWERWRNDPANLK